MTFEEKIAKVNAMRTGMQNAIAAARAAAAEAGLPDAAPVDPGVEMYIPTRHGDVRVRFLAAPGASAPGANAPDAKASGAAGAPDAASPAPVFFNLHGGGFIMGAPEDDAPFCRRVCRELGMAVVNVDYPLAPEKPFPADKEGTYDVVAHVVAHAAEYGIDPDRMAIGGHSAGGNVATAVCMMALKTGAFRFRCQVLDYPPLDIHTNAYDKKLPEGSIPAEVAAFFDECYRTAEQSSDPLCSPVLAKREDLLGMPPAIVLTAERDSLAPEAEAYARMLVEANVEVTLRRFAGALHGFSMNPASPDSDGAQIMMMEGMKRHVQA